MSKKITPTPITPQIQETLNRWNYFARKNNIRLAPPSVMSDMAFKAKASFESGNACVCKPKDRPICPCLECIGEIKRFGICWCHIFCSDEYIANPGKFPHETYEESNGQ